MSEDKTELERRLESQAAYDDAVSKIESPPERKEPAYRFKLEGHIPPGWKAVPLAPNVFFYVNDKMSLKVVVDYRHDAVNDTDHYLMVSVTRPRGPKQSDLAYVRRHFMLVDFPCLHVIGPGYTDNSNTAIMGQSLHRDQPTRPLPWFHSCAHANLLIGIDTKTHEDHPQ